MATRLLSQTMTRPQSGASEAPQEPDVVRALHDDGTIDESLGPALSSEEMVQLYRHMVITRVLDERLVTLQRQGRIGFHVASLGEEAAIIGAAYAMRPQDWLFPCYRELGAALVRGLSLQTFIDNVFGNANDVVKGRQMPDHYTYRAGNYASVSSPVGTQITHAVGVAWAGKLRRNDLASLAYFGDGATSSNEFHSGMNFAGVFGLPVIFFCRNNGWAISTPAERQTATPTFAEKGIAYGVPGVRVDGNDVFAVVAVTRQAVARASAGEGPTLIEAITYRMGAHTTSDDPTRYRTEEELKPWVERDPIERTRNYLLGHQQWDSEREEQLRADIDLRIRQAVTAAERAAPPGLESLHDGVYARCSWHLQEQRVALLQGPRAPSHG
jgi:pyruvate dehydrogenase E1 component alpha subunit